MSSVKLQSEYIELDKYLDIYEDIFYCKKGRLSYHNPYGPAIIYKNGRIDYFIEGKCHRLDGPAIIWSNGTKQYYINDKELTEEEFEIHRERLKFLGKEHLICLG